MAIKPKDIYDGRKKKRSRGSIITISLIVLLALVIALFYGLRGRCIYDSEGNAHIVFPFTQEAKALKEAEKNDSNDAPEETQTPEDDALPQSTATPADDAQTAPPTAEGDPVPSGEAAPTDESSPAE